LPGAPEIPEALRPPSSSSFIFLLWNTCTTYSIYWTAATADERVVQFAHLRGTGSSSCWHETVFVH